MISEDQKERLAMAGLIWLGLLGERAVDWVMKGRSPLVWPNFFGVVEWLAWTGAAGGIAEIAYHQLRTELPKQSRLGDALSLISYFLRWLLVMACLFALIAARFVLFAGDAAIPGWRKFAGQAVGKIAEHGAAAFAIGAGLFLLVSWLALLVIACRMIAVMLRRYDPAAR